MNALLSGQLRVSQDGLFTFPRLGPVWFGDGFLHVLEGTPGCGDWIGSGI